MNSPELVLRKRIADMHKLHLRALASYHAYEELLEHRAPNIHGKELAHARAQAIGVYKGFMNTAQQALQTELYLALSNLYENDDSTLNLGKLISYVQHNQNKVAAGRNYRRETNVNLFSDEEIQSLRDRIESVGELVRKLKRVRDKQVAHTALNIPKDMEYPSYEEFYRLIQLAEDILNEVSKKLIAEYAIFDEYRAQVVDDTSSRR